MSPRMMVSVGDVTRGYYNVDVTKTPSGKYRIVRGTEIGSVRGIKKLVAAINRGDTSYVNRNNQSLPIQIYAYLPSIEL